jgi:hypothetical protein
MACWFPPRSTTTVAGYVYDNNFIEAFARTCHEPATESLFRVLYYDCPQYRGKQRLPVSGNIKTFSASDDRPGAKREPVVAAWGYTVEGRRVLLHLMAASKEDAETVTAFFEDMKMRGLPDPLLVTSDGDGQLWLGR